MTFKGDPLPKRAIQAALQTLGYKIVRAKSYDERMGSENRQNKAFNKLFCIGFNKTATTSLERALLGFGLRMPKQLEQEALLSDVILGGTYQKLSAFCEDFDAFQDLPFSQSTVYVACDALFPGSKFVLTIRDPEAWAESYIRYYTKAFGLDPRLKTTEETFRGKNLYLKKDYVYHMLKALLVEHKAGASVVRWDLAFDQDFLTEIYQRRNSEVLRYFSDRPKDLLVIDPSRESDTAGLLSFLEIEEVAPAPFPRENASR